MLGKLWLSQNMKIPSRTNEAYKIQLSFLEALQLYEDTRYFFHSRPSDVLERNTIFDRFDFHKVISMYRKLKNSHFGWRSISNRTKNEKVRARLLHYSSKHFKMKSCICFCSDMAFFLDVPNTIYGIHSHFK